MKTCGILLLLLASLVLAQGQNNEELGSICYLKELVNKVVEHLLDVKPFINLNIEN